MPTTTPSLQGATSLHGLSTPLIEVLLTSALAACKGGTLADLLRQRPVLTRRIARRYLGPAIGVERHGVGENPSMLGDLLQLWLRSLLAQLRPDHVGVLQIDDEIARDAWIARTSWRPFLAVACHSGMLAVPDFRDRYRRRADESVVDNLCGLWTVGPSTFYRYLDKGKRLLASSLSETPPSSSQRIQLRQAAQQHVDRREQLDTPQARQAWHRRQAVGAVHRHDSVSVLWHLLCAGDASAFIQALQRHRIDLAGDGETDALIERLDRESLDARQQVEFSLAQAALWRTRNAEELELRACEDALRTASAARDPLLLGMVYGSLGRFHETRDTDRAFSCYEESVEFLRQAGLAEGVAADAAIADEYLSTLVKLAWLYLLRNDPRAKAVLDRADGFCAGREVSDVTLAMLDQTWGEYWRRVGDFPRALDRKHRALNRYERLGDQPAVLKTYSNLSLIYGDAKDFPRAIEYSKRVLDMAGRFVVEPETVANTHLNLGAAYFWQGDFTRAIEEYRHALAGSMKANLALSVWRSHYNLAEAHYCRFKESGAVDDERQGDEHARAALSLRGQDRDQATDDATRRLKVDILGPTDDRALDRLLPDEAAAHFAETQDIRRQRGVLAIPGSAETHVHAHLAIARAYLAMASKEREAALALIHKHGLGDRFAAEFDQLQSTFNRELTREQQLASQWAQAAGELLQEQRRIAVLEHLFRNGAIQKSMYAKVCGVGLATASKHLSTLAQLGLLEQTGSGPSTRYVLPH